MEVWIPQDRKTTRSRRSGCGKCCIRYRDAKDELQSHRAKEAPIWHLLAQERRFQPLAVERNASLASKEKPRNLLIPGHLAEREGFEPPYRSPDNLISSYVFRFPVNSIQFLISMYHSYLWVVLFFLIR